MPSERSSDVKFDIGHVLFIDIVGYSKLLISEPAKRCVSPQSQNALAMLLRRALPAAHEGSAHPFPIYQIGS
jgi:hypothetical protein